MGLTRHTVEITDAVFTGVESVRIANHTTGATLTAALRLNSFTGGAARSIILSMFLVGDDGQRFSMVKMNAGAGQLTFVKTHILVYGPAAPGSTFGDDLNSGALPPRFDLEVDADGDQTSADIMLEVMIS